MMSKEESHNGIDNKSVGEGGRSEDNVKLSDSPSEALISNDSGSKSELSLKHETDDKLTNDRPDSIHSNDNASNNRSDNGDSTENTLKTKCQPDSVEGETRIKDDSGDSKVNENDPVQDLSPSDKDDTVSEGKGKSDIRGESNETVEENIGLNKSDPESRPSGDINETVDSVDKESDSGSLHSDSARAEGVEKSSTKEEPESELNDNGGDGSVRRKSTDTTKSVTSNSNETTEKRDEVSVDKFDDTLKEKDTSGEANKIKTDDIDDKLKEKETSAEVNQIKTDDSDGREEYEDDFEDSGEKETEHVENALKDQNGTSNEKVESQPSAIENGNSNEVISTAEDSDNKPEEGEKEEQYEDDFETTEPSNENSKTVEETESHPEDTDKSPASDVDSGGNDQTTKPAEEENIEPDEEVTKVVVDDEGIPKVLVTTVPDRPPSSQASDTEDNYNNEKGDADREIQEDDNKEDVENDNSKSDKVKANDKTESKPELVTEEKPDQGIKQSEEIDQSGDKTDSGVDRTNTEIETTNSMTDESVNKQDTNEVAPKEPTESNSGDRKDSNGSVAKTKFPGEIISEQTDKAEDNTMENKEEKSDDKAPAIDADVNKSDRKEVENEDGHTKQNAEIEAGKKTDEEKDEKPVETEAKEDKVKDPKPVEPEPPKKTESPLDKLLQRHVEIDGTVESITDLEQNVFKLLTSMKDVMTHYNERLKLQTLKEITDDMGKFRGDFQSVNEAFKAYSSMTININHRLKDLRHVTEDVKTQISRKFVSEDLSTWVDQTPEQEKEKDKLQDEMFASEKAAMSKAAEARQAMATATVGVAQANQFVTELEVQTAEAEAIAIKAAAQAKASLIAAEEARKAAEERRIAEDAAKRRADERAKAKAEEAKKKKAEEEMVIHMEAAKKGTSVEDEREKFLKEKARKEEERRNPKNWPRFSYTATGKDFNPCVGCVIRAIDGSMRARDVVCETVDQSTNVLKLRENEELVSNIIRVNPTDLEKKFSFEEPMSLALPVCFNRVMLGREAVVKQLVSSGAWKELPSGDVQFEDYREIRFMEGRSRTFGTFAVVLRSKKDTVQFPRKGGRVVASVDSRITFTNQNGTFKALTNGILENGTSKQLTEGILEVQAIDVNTIPELKLRTPAEFEDLLTSSPVIRLTLPAKRLDKPMTVTVPLPSTQSRQTRPSTGVARQSAQEQARPATAGPGGASKEEEIPEDIRFLYKDDKNGWTVNKKLQISQLKNKDIAMFDIKEPYERFVVLRTKPGVKDLALEKMATLLERALTQRNVKVSLRQHQHDAAELAIVCTTSIRANKALKNLDDEGYTDGPSPSPGLILQEGQQLYMKFRGNIQCVSENPTLTMIFNSHIRASRKLQVSEIDVFAQKSIHCYRGFVQIFTKALVPKPSTSEGTQKAAPPEMTESEILLTELLVELPKPEAEPPKPLRVAPVSLNDSPLTHLMFRHLASELGKEWRDLGTHLNLKPTRIQAILRQNVNRDTPQTRYDMLVTWAKRIPKGVDKTQILYTALLACGRPDLAEEVKYKGNEFRQQRLNRARASHLKQAFVKVAKCAAVFKHWQTFAKRLGVPEDDIKRIDETEGSGQEKCYTILETWGETAGDKATIPELSTQLKHVKQTNLSKEVETIMVT